MQAAEVNSKLDPTAIAASMDANQNMMKQNQDMMNKNTDMMKDMDSKM